MTTQALSTRILGTVESAFSINPLITNSLPIKTNEPSIFIKQNHQFIKVSYNHISYIESDGNYINVVTNTNKKYVIKRSITEIQEKLQMANMLRVHRSYLVNINHIHEFSANEISINKMIIPIGRKYQKDFLDIIKHIYSVID